ncbi:hypothetical protein ACIRU8_42475 [Streptomyces sp. NPDC101175]|uniref:hypothetical protein n=1 Tax=Streptomyces sp. NPDC101175 TaxID=3366123 RepID=UPI00383630DC
MTDLISDQDVAAIIMLGSLLEGVMVHVVQERDAFLLGGTSPGQDTLNMCRPVVNAVLNDLADSRPKAA